MKWQVNSQGTIFTNEVTAIRIHRIVNCSGWYLSCAELGFSQYRLKGESFDEAVIDAKRLIKDKMNLIKEKYDGFLNDNSKNDIVQFF